MPDLASLNLGAFMATLLLFTAADVAVSVGIALANGNFSGEYLMDFAKTHILLKVLPIFALAIIGDGIPALGIPASPPVNAAAVVAGGLYLANTVASIKGSLDDKAVPPPTE